MPDFFQSFDESSTGELAALVADHRQAALGTVHAGAPYCSMVAYLPEAHFAGFLVHLSNLSAHKAHLIADPHASLLIFEPDDGQREILQHRRLTLDCLASLIPKDTPEYESARAAYLARYPRHAMMFTLGDFDLVRLTPRGGLLNAGFGRAFQVTPADLSRAAARLADV